MSAMDTLTSELLLGDGLPVYITSKYGTTRRSVIQIEREANMEPKLVWSRKHACELSFVSSILAPVSSGDWERIAVNFTDFTLFLDVPRQPSQEVFAILTEMHKKAVYIRNLERDYQLTKASNNLQTTYPQTMSLKSSLCKAACKEEQLNQLITYLRYKEGYIGLERNVLQLQSRRVGSAFKQWIRATKDANDEHMTADRERWRLHAASNLEIDLQAWYHALFYKEVYRLRGHFWYKDAVLPGIAIARDVACLRGLPAN